MHELLDSLVLKELNNDILIEKKDSAILKIGSKKLAFTTDSYVVNPIFFPGGDIGSLAVHGTVNDLAVCGARPAYLSLAVIIEEGLDRHTLEKVISSIKKAARASSVKVVTGDTKVVENGSCDKLFINTSGIGVLIYEGLSIDSIRPGDVVLVNGPIGEHAISVLSKREGIDFGSRVRSDSQPLNGLIAKMLGASAKIRFMRDPTRGGVATTLNEMVKDMPFGISLDEKELPITNGVREACEFLGFDPLYLACEGRVLVVVEPSDEKKLLNIMNIMRRNRAGIGSRRIGVVTDDHNGKVFINTQTGGKRIVDMLSGGQLPRIC